MTDNTVRGIAWLTALLVFALAVGSFALSYEALRHVAEAFGKTGWQSFVWPLLIDVSLIVFSLKVVSDSLHGENTWKGWMLVGFFTVLTVVFNILHAPNNLWAQVVAAIVPISLFLSFETLMDMLRRGVLRRTEHVTERPPEPEQSTPNASGQTEPERAERTTPNTEHPAVQFWRKNNDATLSDIAEQTDFAKSSVRAALHNAGVSYDRTAGRWVNGSGK